MKVLNTIGLSLSTSKEKFCLIDGSPLQTTCCEFCLWWPHSFENVCNGIQEMFNSLFIFSLTVSSDGAALFYTSVKENKNCTLFLKYILHRIYGLPFNSSALVVDKDSVFM